MSNALDTINKTKEQMIQKFDEFVNESRGYETVRITYGYGNVADANNRHTPDYAFQLDIMKNGQAKDSVFQGASPKAYYTNTFSSREDAEVEYNKLIAGHNFAKTEEIA